MKKTVGATCAVFASACMICAPVFALDKADVKQRVSREGREGKAGRWKTCPLPNGSEFLLTADGRNVGKHDVFSAGRIRDAFAYGYAVKYVGENFATALPSFTDDSVDCVNYAMSGNTIYALTDRATFRFMAANGKRGGSVLVVSRDGGHTFSGNIHPNALEKADGDQAIHAAFRKFGYHRSRFRVVGEQYQLEITDPLTLTEFLLFVSSDGGNTWTSSISTKQPAVFPSIEVEDKRNRFATNEWTNKLFRVIQEACRQRPGVGCAIDTDEYWGGKWRACLKEHSAQECLKTLPDPALHFPANEQGKL